MVPIPTIALPHYTTSFIGRTTEISEIEARLHDLQCRLLTLVGSGGSGKTRLAIEAARHLLETFPDGVYFVALQPVQSAEHVLSAVIEALPLQASSDSREYLLDYLQNKRLLLVIDNFEHVLDGAVLLPDILNAAPEVKFVTTSRESLKLREEWLYDVGGLDYPARSNHQNAPEAYSAVQLFIERARQLRNNALSENQMGDIVQICQLVEGMPLALELASGWTRAFSCKEIARELRHNLDLLTTSLQNVPERHRSMQAVFQHSWSLLTDNERQVMRCFAVFRGGCTREAAEQVAGATVQTLAALVDKSLLRYSPETGRYDIQELLRQYTEMQLEQSGEADAAQDTHAHYYAASFYARKHENDGPLAGAYWDAIGADLDNIRAAWARGLRRANYEIINRLVGTIASYFFNRSHALEALAMFTTASSQLADCTDATEQTILGHLLAYQGKCECSYGYYDLAEKSLRKSMAINQAQNKLGAYHYAQRWLALTLWFRDGVSRKAEAQQMLEDCAAFYSQKNDQHNLAHTLKNMSDVASDLTRLKDSTRRHQESMALFWEMSSLNGTAHHFQSLALEALVAGRWDEAEQYLEEGFSQKPASRHLTTTMQLLATRGALAIAMGDFDLGKSLTEEAIALCDRAVRPMAWDIWVRVMCRFALAKLADANGTELDVRRQIDEALALIEISSFRADNFMNADLAWVLCSLGQFENASQCLCKRLHTSQKLHEYGDMLYGISTFARVLAHQGVSTRAAELLGLIFTHPNSPRGFLEKHPKMARLRADLEATLGTPAYAAAWERGTRLDVEQAVHQLLKDFDPKTNDSITQANQQLSNPLTERELEVLRLLAEGLTNPRIGERLFIETGTVKGHVNKILQKLDVEDRQQAAIRAYTLRLV